MGADHGLERRRITPAHAGKRACMTMATTQRRDHPRVCGEKGSFIVLSEGMIGSPPRVRGKATMIEMASAITGITPACAGKSGWTASKKPAGRDHPRVCGEKRDNVAEQFMGGGSPPRVRGKALIFS